MKRSFLLICFLALAACAGPAAAGTLKDIESKLHKGEKAGDEGTKGDCILKVTKKTAATTDYSSIKFYYVIYHCASNKQLTVELTARNKKEEFVLPEAQNTEGASSDLWTWEQSKGFLPKYFAKDKPGRRIIKFVQNKDLCKKYGPLQGYKVVLKDGANTVDTLEWNWGRIRGQETKKEKGR